MDPATRNNKLRKRTRLSPQLRAQLQREEAVVDLSFPVLPVRGDPPALVIPDDHYDYAPLEAANGIDPRSVADKIAALSRIVCRIDFNDGVNSSHLGTGFLVAPDIVMTCRHVVARFAEISGANWQLRQNFSGFAHFALEPETAVSQGIAVTEILYAGTAQSTSLALDRDETEIAMLRLAHPPDSAPAGPDLKRLLDWQFDHEANGISGRAVAIVSYPGNPFTEDAGGNRHFTDANLANVPILLVTRQFESPAGALYGSCCASLGTILANTFLDDPHSLFSGHSCSTLGGSSGAPVYDISDDRIIGIHCGGIFKSANHVQLLQAAIHRIGGGQGLEAVLMAEGII